LSLPGHDVGDKPVDLPNQHMQGFRIYASTVHQIVSDFIDFREEAAGRERVIDLPDERGFC
jgi:hypothetical protein